LRLSTYFKNKTNGPNIGTGVAIAAAAPVHMVSPTMRLPVSSSVCSGTDTDIELEVDPARVAEAQMATDGKMSTEVLIDHESDKPTSPQQQSLDDEQIASSNEDPKSETADNSDAINQPSDAASASAEDNEFDAETSTPGVSTAMQQAAARRPASHW